MSHTRWSGAVVLSLMALAALPLPAQAPDEPQAEQRPSTVSLKFGGGPVLEYIQALRAASLGTNIVLDEEVSAADMPALELKKVGLMTAIDLVSRLAKKRPGQVITNEVLENEGNPVYILKLELDQSGFSINTGPLVPPGVPVGFSDTPTQSIQIFSLRDLIEGSSGDPSLKLKPETVLSAVQEALSDPRATQEEQPSVRFHAESSLLIVRGNPAQIAVVKQVVESLPGSPERRKDRQAEAALKEKEARLEQLQAEGAKVRDELEMYRSKVRALEREVGELSKVVDLIRNEKSDLQKRYNDLAAKAGQGTGSAPAEGGKP
jgi:hypothetical protein